MNNWIEIDEERLGQNFQVLQAAVGQGTEVLAVVKANAYGHGAELCARVLVRAGARWLGVTCANEGARVRRALEGLAAEQRILVMSGFLPEDVPLLREYVLTPVVWMREHLEWLSDGAGMAVHVEVDTGMGRQGVLPGRELADLLREIAVAGLRLGGIFTHFCSSEIAGSELTLHQQILFEQAVLQVKEAGLRPAWVHAGNSSTVDNPAQEGPWLVNLAATVGARAMVRSGLALYGYCLRIEGSARRHVNGLLLPVMTWKARVLSVRDLATGESVGYNATFTADRSMRIALLPVGYADGLRRELSWRSDGRGGWVMLNGRKASILGRISMNLTVVDVTDYRSTRPGDLATILGPGITAEDHARLAGTIAYEILCGIHPCG